MRKGKNKQPMALTIMQGGNVKKSNETINRYKEHTKKMQVGEKTLIASQNILNNPVALRKWNELTKIYSEFEFVTEVDTSAIEKYCIMTADWQHLIDCRRDIMQKSTSNLGAYAVIKEMGLDEKINKKVDTLMHLEDRLFLNPLSRLKSVPKKQEEKKESHLESLGFGNL